MLGPRRRPLACAAILARSRWRRGPARSRAPSRVRGSRGLCRSVAARVLDPRAPALWVRGILDAAPDAAGARGPTAPAQGGGRWGAVDRITIAGDSDFTRAARRCVVIAPAARRAVRMLGPRRRPLACAAIHAPARWRRGPARSRAPSRVRGSRGLCRSVAARVLDPRAPALWVRGILDAAPDAAGARGPTAPAQRGGRWGASPRAPRRHARRVTIAGGCDFTRAGPPVAERRYRCFRSGRCRTQRARRIDAAWSIWLRSYGFASSGDDTMKSAVVRLHAIATL